MNRTRARDWLSRLRATLLSPRGLTIAQLAAAVVALLLLRLKWATVRDVVVAIDHGDVLFADFVHHYYPTVEGPLRHSGPAGGFFYPAAFAVMIVRRDLGRVRAALRQGP